MKYLIVHLLVAVCSCAAVTSLPSRAAASGAEKISRLPCDQATQNAIARQRWSSAGQPFGVPYSDWGQPEFDALKNRVLQCGGSRSYIAYLEHL